MSLTLLHPTIHTIHFWPMVRAKDVLDEDTACGMLATTKEKSDKLHPGLALKAALFASRTHHEALDQPFAHVQPRGHMFLTIREAPGGFQFITCDTDRDYELLMTYQGRGAVLVAM